MKGIKAIVQKIVTDGEHGSYAVATSEEVKGSITFSFEENVWQEPYLPESGTEVVLSKLVKKRAGWRAMSARFFSPSDERVERSKEIEKQHPKNLSALRRYYKETGRRVAPNLHINSKVEWIIHDLGKSCISVRCIYRTEYTGKKQFKDEHHCLIDALEKDQEVLNIPLIDFMGWYASSTAGREEVSINYGKEYRFSVQDLPLELRVERDVLLERHDTIRRARKILESVSKQLTLKNIETDSDRLELQLHEAAKLCAEAKYSEFENDLTKHQTHIITYLKITEEVSKNWWWS